MLAVTTLHTGTAPTPGTVTASIAQGRPPATRPRIERNAGRSRLGKPAHHCRRTPRPKPL
eukprot:1081118-Pyramimonas_sp.AAC.1